MVVWKGGRMGRGGGWSAFIFGEGGGVWALVFGGTVNEFRMGETPVCFGQFDVLWSSRFMLM